METYLFKLLDRRINADTYLTGVFINVLFCLTVGLILLLNQDSFVNYVPNNLKIFLAFIFLFVELLIYVSLLRRRAHDVGVDPWSWPESFVFKEGQKEENQYGNPPPAYKIDFKGLFGF
jgi:uncharacterized membrane protein YhaH (DUF805 family)